MISRHLKRITFTPIDAAWLHMGLAPGQTMVGGLALLDEPLTADDLMALLRARLLRYRRFRQRPRQPLPWPAWPLWEDDPDFSLDAHVHTVTLSRPDDPEALRQLLQELMSATLPQDKPLWQIHLVEQLGSGGALILRFEHTLADGSAMMQVIQTLTDASPEAVWQEPAPRPLDSALLAAVSGAYHVGMALPELLMRGAALARQPLYATGWSLKALQALGKLVFIPPDPDTILKGRRDLPNRIAYSTPIPLVDIKKIGKTQSCTVNDVLLSAMSGGIRSYLIDRGENPEGLSISSLVPVDLRRGGDASGLGNKFGLVFLTLPVGIADPVERLQALHENMDAIKRSPEAWVSFWVMSGLGLAPRRLEQLGVRFFCTKATATMTNVRGPGERLYLAGRPISQVLIIPPHPGDLAIGMGIISYAGNVIVTLNTDAAIIPRPQEIIAGFHDDFLALQQAAGVEETPAKRVEAPKKKEKARKPAPQRTPVAA